MTNRTNRPNEIPAGTEKSVSNKLEVLGTRPGALVATGPFYFVRTRSLGRKPLFKLDITVRLAYFGGSSDKGHPLTTIAFRSGILAADTLISYNSFTNGHRQKIERAGNYYVALAGPAWLREIIEPWVEQGCPRDAVPEALLDEENSFAALIIDPEGRPHEFNNGFLVPVYADYTAIGSGALFALGAMAHGATAEEAVKAASLHDKNTGGPVTSISLNS